MTIEIALSLGCNYYIGEAIKYRRLFRYSSRYELIDRLYRKYVRYDDIDATRDLVKQIFDSMMFTKKLCDTFLEAYDSCVDDVKNYTNGDKRLYGKHKGGCSPIRIINVTDPIVVLYAAVESLIPDEDYDNLEGDPLWMRPEYMIEKYG